MDEEEEEKEEVGSSEVGSSGKVIFVREGRAGASRVEAGAVKEGSGFLPSRRVLGRAIKASLGSCHQGGCGFLKQVKGESNSLLVQILLMAVVAVRAVPEARGSGSIGASRAGQV